jgi:hypothetical protein
MIATNCRPIDVEIKIPRYIRPARFALSVPEWVTSGNVEMVRIS